MDTALTPIKLNFSTSKYYLSFSQDHLTQQQIYTFFPCCPVSNYTYFIIIFNKMGGICPSCTNVEESLELDYHSEVYLEEALINGEQLYNVGKNQMEELLHENIGPLLFKVQSEPGKIGRGSGTLISPDLVLTAAHNIYSHDHQENHYDFFFYPGQSGPLDKGYAVEKYFVPPQFKKNSNPTNDYALLKLDRKVKRKQFIALCGDVKKLKQTKYFAELALFGYPSGKQYYKQLSKTGDREETSQWGLTKKGRIDEIREQQESIIHLISSLPGQSGAPLILIEPDRMTIIAVHKGSAHSSGRQARNIGRLVTHQLIEILRRQAYKMGAMMFNVYSQKRRQTQYQQFGSLHYFQEGIKLRNAQLFREAIQMFNKAIELDQNYSEAYNNLGNVHFLLKQKQQAIKCYTKAIKINPVLEEAYNNLGNVYYDMKFQALADKCYRKAIEINSSYADAYNNLGNILYLQKQTKKAVECYKRAIEIDCNFAKPYRNWIKIVSNLNEAKDAQKYFAKIKSKYPKCSLVNQALKKLQTKIF